MTSQLFESSSLEEALAEVRDTVGPHAKIVRAEKVRRGGIGGFFSKETFVLSVEPGVEPAGRPAPPAAATTAVTSGAQPTAYSLEALADLADSADSDALSVAVAAPAVSTESSLFDQILREASRGTELDQVLPPGPRWDGATLDEDPIFRSVMPLAPVPQAPVAPPAPAPAVLIPAPPVVPSMPWWQVLSDVAEAQLEPQQVISTGARTIDLLGSAYIDDLSVVSTPDPVEDPAAGLAAINVALGPALLPGSVIAVVGHPTDARTVAARVAVAAAADPFSIHFASHDPAARADSGLPVGRQVASLDEAILRSRRWPSRPTPVVIVVDGRDSRWARTVLDAVEATTVVALPSPHDDDDAVRGWVSELGGVQALIVDDSCQATPESLALQGIPALRSPWAIDSPARRSAAAAGAS